jgi:zinc finger protein AEBP2
LKKNYGLDNYITQSNSFIIFDSFFSENSILNYDTEFDNDTYRVIQTLRTPEYFNTHNYPINNFRLNTSYRKLTSGENNSKKFPILRQNEYDNNYNEYEDEINHNHNNKNNNYNKLQRSMSPIGKQLIYNDNNYANNKGNKQNYDERMNNINENNVNKSNIRENELNNKVYIKNNNRYKDDELYNKRYNNSSLFDDKKVPDNQYNNRNNLFRSHDYIYQKEYQDLPMKRRNNEKIYSNQIPENYDDNNNKDNEYYEKRRNRNTEYSDNYNINDYYDDRRNYDNIMYY